VTTYDTWQTLIDDTNATLNTLEQILNVLQLGGNESVPSGSTAVSNAANRPGGAVIDLIDRVITDLATLTVTQIVDNLLTSGGWRASVLYDFVSFLASASSSWTTIRTETAVSRYALICVLCGDDLLQATAKAWAESYTNFSTTTQEAVARAIDSYSVQYVGWIRIIVQKSLQAYPGC
jgi:hypothetical protein